MPSSTVNFDSKDLAASVPGLIITATTPYRSPNRDLSTAQVANSDKSFTSASYFKDKKINVSLEIGRDTRELLEVSLDILYGILQAREAPLILPYGSSSRKWTATIANVSIANVLGGHAELELEFLCADPFGYDLTSTPIFSEVLTGAYKTHQFTLAGTARLQQPIITIVYSALGGASGASVVIDNSANGQAAVVTRDFSTGDILIFDSVKKTVTVNGDEVDYTGAIPEWTPGFCSMGYQDTFTSRTRTISMAHTKRYT